MDAGIQAATVNKAPLTRSGALLKSLMMSSSRKRASAAMSTQPSLRSEILLDAAGIQAPVAAGTKSDEESPDG